MNLRLRPLRPVDEGLYRTAQVELLADRFLFGFINEGEAFADHFERLRRQRRGLDLGELVEASWLIADAGEVVGRTSIRLELNAHLAFHGGHIGSAVRPAFRRRDESIGARRFG